MLNVPLLPAVRVTTLALTGAGRNGQYGREEEWAERLYPGHLLRRAEEVKCGTVGWNDGGKSLQPLACQKARARSKDEGALNAQSTQSTQQAACCCCCFRKQHQQHQQHQQQQQQQQQSSLLSTF